jgi:phosphoribosylformylglycinamidine synthase
LLERLPGVVGLSAEYQYFVAVSRELTPSERERLGELVEEHSDQTLDEPARDAAGRHELVIVAPRLGTVSPWASKATDIAHACGLASVERIERGVAFVLTHERAGVRLGPDARRALYDAMTQSAFASYGELAALFAHGEPSPYRHVDVLGQGRAALEQADRELGLALARRRTASIAGTRSSRVDSSSMASPSRARCSR